MPRKLLLILLLCLTAGFTHAQQLISVHARNQPLSEVIANLSSAYHLRFAYSTDQVNLDRKVSLELSNAALDSVLERLMAGSGISYRISGAEVLLFRDASQRITISGYIREKNTGELLPGVLVATDPPRAGCISNAYGFYSVTLSPGSYTLRFTYLGFNPALRQVDVSEETALNIVMEPSLKLDEVTVSAEGEDEHRTLNTIKVPLKEISAVPAVLGEKDVLKYMMLMPGVQKGNEGNASMFVRGGAADQNLVLIDDAVIYNANHYLGLASLFTGSEIKSAELIKGGFSSKYGGRLSSVLDMSMKDGNREQFGGEATLGVISSRLLLEGPIRKDHSSFLISARRSYIDEISRLFVSNDADRLGYNFYDLHAKLSTDLGSKDRLMVSGYLGQDVLKNASGTKLSADDDGVKWGNGATTLRWSHQYNGKLFSNASLVYSFYQSRFAFTTGDQPNQLASAGVQSTINDYTAKCDWDYLPSGYNHIRMGAGFTRHTFDPFTFYNTASQQLSTYNTTHANEAFAYIESQLQVGRRWQLTPGIRFSYYGNNATYFRAEPRFSALYKLPASWTLNASYALMNQYQHLITSFSGFGLPNDVWIGTDKNVAPQRSQLITLGVSKSHIAGSSFSVAVEGYYKYISEMLVLQNGASFFLLLPFNGPQATLQNWSDLVTSGSSRSYGVEFSLRKEGKRFSGFISYTLSKTSIQAPEVNNGNIYPATYDRRHDIGVYLSYRTKKRFAFSADWIFGTGNAISLPVGAYVAAAPGPYATGNLLPVYDYNNRNSYRMIPYHRMDVSMQYLHRMGTRLSGTIELSVYNVYNRANALAYNIGNTDTGHGITKTSLFPIIPSLSWTIRF